MNKDVQWLDHLRFIHGDVKLDAWKKVEAINNRGIYVIKEKSKSSAKVYQCFFNEIRFDFCIYATY